MDIPKIVIENSISRGDILHSTIFEDIDHGKFFVVMGVDKEYIVGFFYINSRINRYIQCKPEQYMMQYEIKCADYGFLKHNSFINAVDLNILKRDDIAKSISDGETSVVDRLRSEHLNELLALVRESKMYSKAYKKRFFS